MNHFHLVPMFREEFMSTGDSEPQAIDLTMAEGCSRCGGHGSHAVTERPDVIASGCDYAVRAHCSCQYEDYGTKDHLYRWGFAPVGGWTVCPLVPDFDADPVPF